MSIFIAQTENQQKEMYIRGKLELLEKTDYLHSSLSTNIFNQKVYREFLISSLNGYSDIIIMSDINEILFTNNTHVITKPEYFEKVQKRVYGSYEINYLNVRRTLMYTFNSKNNKYYIIIEPYEQVLTSLKPISNSIIFVLISSMLLLIGMVVLASNKISSTLNHLTEMVKNYRENIHPPLFTDMKSKKIFIDELYKVEIEIHETINYVIEKENKQTKEFYKSKLQNLQSQINPHFLYNTLENINQLAMMNEIEEISKLSRGLANLFRYNMDDKKYITTVRQELHIISEYINIMKIRFPNIDYILNFSNEYLLDTDLLKFTLQPLVENIFKHQSLNLDTFHIIISIYTKDECRFIEIYTNQSVIENVDLKRVNFSINNEHDSKSNGIGLYNVNKRIQLHYGEDYGIYLNFKENQIITTTVYLPL